MSDDIYTAKQMVSMLTDAYVKDEKSNNYSYNYTN